MPAIPPLNHPSSSSEASIQPRAALSSLLSDAAARIRLRSTSPIPQPHLRQRDSQSLIAATSSSPSSGDRLQPRQAAPRYTLPPIPAEYRDLNTGPAPGTIVGIVFGSVLGFLLLFWLVVVVAGNRANAQYVEGDDTEIVVRRDHHSSRRSRHTRTRHSRSETSEASHRPPPRQHSSPRRSRTERILVTETRRTESRAPPPPVSQPSVVQERESINIRSQSRASRRVEGDDMVEVIEEHSEVSQQDPPRRKKSGYRTVDPTQYAGGNYPQRDVYNDRSRSKRNR